MSSSLDQNVPSKKSRPHRTGAATAPATAPPTPEKYASCAASRFVANHAARRCPPPTVCAAARGEAATCPGAAHAPSPAGAPRRAVSRARAADPPGHLLRKALERAVEHVAPVNPRPHRVASRTPRWDAIRAARAGPGSDRDRHWSAARRRSASGAVARGQSAGNDSICARISGEALIKNQRSPSALTAHRFLGARPQGAGHPRARRRSYGSRSSIAEIRRPPRSREPGSSRVGGGASAARWRGARPAARASRYAARAGPRDRGPKVALIAADLGAHVDLDECRGFPFHRHCLSQSSEAEGLFSRAPSESQAAPRAACYPWPHVGYRQPFEQAFLRSPDFDRRRRGRWRTAASAAAGRASTSAPRKAARSWSSTRTAARWSARIPVGKRPRGIKLSRDGKTLYVALSGSPRGGPGVDESKLPPADRAADGVGVVDVASRKLVRTLHERPGPRVVRRLARRQDPVRLQRGDRRDDRARPRHAARSSAASRSATSRRA